MTVENAARLLVKREIVRLAQLYQINVAWLMSSVELDMWLRKNTQYNMLNKEGKDIVAKVLELVREEKYVEATEMFCNHLNDKKRLTNTIQVMLSYHMNSLEELLNSLLVYLPQ